MTERSRFPRAKKASAARRRGFAGSREAETLRRRIRPRSGFAATREAQRLRGSSLPALGSNEGRTRDASEAGRERPGAEGEQSAPGRGGATADGRVGRGLSKELATPGRLSAVLALVAGAVPDREPATARTGGRAGCRVEPPRARARVHDGGLRDDLLHELELRGGIDHDLGRAHEAEHRLVLDGQESLPEPAEHVIDDRLGEADLRVAGPATRLETDVPELLHEVRERHAVLEQQGDARGEGIHHSRERRALLRHLDEDLAGSAVVKEPDGDVALVTFDGELVRDGVARVGETPPGTRDLDDALGDGRALQRVGALPARPKRLDLLAAVAIDGDRFHAVLPGL